MSVHNATEFYTLKMVKMANFIMCIFPQLKKLMLQKFLKGVLLSGLLSTWNVFPPSVQQVQSPGSSMSLMILFPIALYSDTTHSSEPLHYWCPLNSITILILIIYFHLFCEFYHWIIISPLMRHNMCYWLSIYTH